MIKSKLKVLLALHDMTQKELAEKTGVRPETISNIINNKIRQIPVDALNSICNLFDCQPNDVFEFTKENNE